MALFGLITLSGMSASNQTQKLADLLHRESGPHVVVFLVDGVGQSTFQNLLSTGKLPSLQRYFSDHTISVASAGASIPTETMTNLAGILTGTLAGHHGIVGSRWRRPSDLKERRYEYKLRDLLFDSGQGKFRVNKDLLVPTVFEILEPRETASVLSWVSGGRTMRRDPVRGLVWSKLTGWGNLDDMAIAGFRSIINESIRAQRFPVFTFVHMIESDRTAHRRGTQTGHYEKAVIRADRHIGKILSLFESAGVLDRIYWVVTSDHGMVDLHAHVPVTELLKKALAPAGSSVSVAADRFAQVYWSNPESDAIEESALRMLQQESVDVVAVRTVRGNPILIASRRGQAVVGSDEKYTIVSGSDPLCSALCGPLSEAALQIRTLFKNDRTGNLLIFAAEDWTFREGNRGGHGGLSITELTVPLLVRGPGLDREVIPSARTIDLMPSLLDVIGIPSNTSLDGDSLLTSPRPQ